MPVLNLTADDVGVRLDRLLRQKLAHTPLSGIFKLIRKGGVRVNRRKVDGSYRVAHGDVVDVYINEAEIVGPDVADSRALERLAGTRFFERNFRVLYEDDAVIACDKPIGLVVHPGSGHTTQDSLIDLARAYMLRKRAGSEDEPCLVHRLDRDTSGVILLAKNRRTLRNLNEALRQGGFEKRYLLVCHSRPPRKSGVIELDLVKTYERNDGTKMAAGEDGLASRTIYRVVKTGPLLTMVDVQLDTGRTHQIRVHFQHIHCPIVGDMRYGDELLDKRLFADRQQVHRLYLHARQLTFPHPRTGRPITVTSQTPECFDQVLGARGAGGE